MQECCLDVLEFFSSWVANWPKVRQHNSKKWPFKIIVSAVSWIYSKCAEICRENSWTLFVMICIIFISWTIKQIFLNSLTTVLKFFAHGVIVCFNDRRIEFLECHGRKILREELATLILRLLSSVVRCFVCNLEYLPRFLTLFSTTIFYPCRTYSLKNMSYFYL